MSTPARPDGEGPIVGIDLGTTNSLVAIADERGPRVLAGPGEEPILPSVVRYEADPESPGRVRAVVGEDARARAVEFPRTTVASIKRLMGRGTADAGPDLPLLGCEVVAGENDTARVRLPSDALGVEKIVSPQEVSAEILRALKARAQAALGVPVRRAVVTVPAYFDDAQRQATRDAGRIAGLEVVRILNEPTAAALAYGMGLRRQSARNRAPELVAVYDLGGGTFDISILRVVPAAEGGGSAAADVFQVVSTAGDTRLGGDDVDRGLAELFLSEIGVAAERLAPEARRAVLGFARGVKHRLSTEATASVRIDTGGGVYERTVTRDEIEAMMAPWVERTMTACDRALRDAARELDGEAIGRVVLVGGSTRVPLVRRRVAEKFGVEPYTALDPDLVVAMGAAVQASALAAAEEGREAEALLLDVIPLSLGLETRGGAFAKLIVRNSPVPARATEMFSTSADHQTGVELNVYQGEREMVADCRLLGAFRLSGLPPMPAGIPQLEVEFLVDANGVLRVAAHERRSGKRAELQVVPNHGLTETEVDRMEAESLEHAADDMTRHRVVDLIENARLDAKWIRERVDRFEGDLEPSYRDELEQRLARVQGFIARATEDWRSVDPEAFAGAREALDHASVRLQEISIAASLREDEAGRDANAGPGPSV